MILQVDTQADSFLLALKADTGETAWKTTRDELPSWGTPTVAVTPAGPQLVTNASNFIRGYDPATGKELWRLGGSSKITAPTPVFADGVFVIASGRRPERPIFVVRPTRAATSRSPAGKTTSDAVVWSRTGRGSYMPTPLVYKGLLYVLGERRHLRRLQPRRPATEIYRQRLTNVGNGFSASPVAADGKIYLSNEDGDIVVVAAGPEFKQLATNPMGELLMATPALSDGVMYVRTATQPVRDRAPRKQIVPISEAWRAWRRAPHEVAARIPGALESIADEPAQAAPERPRAWGRMTPNEMCATSPIRSRSRSASGRSRRPTHGCSEPCYSDMALRTSYAWPKGIKTRPEVEQGVGGTRPGDFEQRSRPARRADAPFRDRRRALRQASRLRPADAPRSG